MSAVSDQSVPTTIVLNMARRSPSVVEIAACPTRRFSTTCATTASRPSRSTRPTTATRSRTSCSSELIDAFESARDDERVRCVVLTSSHEKVFSAGGSLDQFAADVPLVHKHFGTERFPRLFRTIMRPGQADDLRRQRPCARGRARRWRSAAT